MIKAMCESVAQLVQESGKSIRKISDISGVPESTIRKIIHGETEDPRYSTIRSIILACGGSVDRVLGIAAQNSAQCVEKCAEFDADIAADDAEDDAEETVSTGFYERMIKYLRDRLDASYTANEQIRLQNTELVKINARLIEQEATTRSRNRGLYTGMIIATAIAGLCLAGLVAYFVYDVMSPTWGIVRY